MTVEEGDLNAFIAAIDDATGELGDSIKSGLMSDSKSAVYDVERAAAALPVSPTVLADIVGMTREAWSCVSGPEEVYERAGKTIAELGKLRRYVEAIRRNLKV